MGRSVRDLRWVTVMWAGLFVCGCTEEASDETPSGALRMFVDAMSRSEREPEALRDAYRLLSEDARRALAERARDASALGGREFAPWEMLVGGRFRQTFFPARGRRGMRATIEGDRATVTVRDEDGDRSADVPMIREDGRWRVVLAVPVPAR